MIGRPGKPGAHQRRSTCRVCGSDALVMFLSLGPTALANAFLRSPEDFEFEDTYPLDVFFCEACSLMQLLDVIDPKALFGEYLYVTGTSETIARHNTAFASRFVRSQGLSAGDLVVEVASNDGSLLKCFRKHGVRTLGVEPARNIAELARADGIETVSRFFDAATAEAIRSEYGAARMVVANNVLAHVDEAGGFLEGCRSLLEGGGILVVEAPYVADLIDRVEYDTIYHEHLCYFSVTTLSDLMARSGLSVRDVERVSIHGGSLRVVARPARSGESHAESVLSIIRDEQGDGTTELETYQRFADRTRASRQATIELLGDLTEAGESVAGYGAPAKGNTLLSYCGIGPDLLPYTVDKNPLKVNRFTPGTHIPVLPTSVIEERRPDYLLLLAWNFADEIMCQQKRFAARGGRFIVPVPHARVVAS